MAKRGGKGVNYTEYISPFGKLILVSDGEVLTGLYLPEQKFDTGNRSYRPELPVFLLAQRWLSRYFAGENPPVDFPVKPAGTEFQRRVWKHLREIPYGKTETYGQIARKISRTMSAQAVGGAVGRNPISIVIPCHRCVGAGGRLTGYAGGLTAKRYLLQLEEKHYDGKRISEAGDDHAESGAG